MERSQEVRAVENWNPKSLWIAGYPRRDGTIYRKGISVKEQTSRARMPQLACSVLLTGSNRGIGLGLVQALVNMNPPPDHIFAACREPNCVRAKTLQDLAAKHSNVHVIQLDVTDYASVKAALGSVESHLKGKGLNLVINNAGRNSLAPLLQDVDQQDMLLTYCTNAVGPALIVKEFLPLLKKAAGETSTKEMSCHRAAVINITSLIGSIGSGFEAVIVPVPPMYAYRASKAALNMITACLAVELKKDGILCALIHPGWVKTDMGSDKAPMTVQTSAESMLKVMASLSSSSTGAFLDWEGNHIPW